MRKRALVAVVEFCGQCGAGPGCGKVCFLAGLLGGRRQERVDRQCQVPDAATRGEHHARVCSRGGVQPDTVDPGRHRRGRLEYFDDPRDDRQGVAVRHSVVGVPAGQELAERDGDGESVPGGGQRRGGVGWVGGLQLIMVTVDDLLQLLSCVRLQPFRVGGSLCPVRPDGLAGPVYPGDLACRCGAGPAGAPGCLGVRVRGGLGQGGGQPVGCLGQPVADLGCGCVVQLVGWAAGGVDLCGGAA